MLLQMGEVRTLAEDLPGGEAVVRPANTSLCLCLDRDLLQTTSPGARFPFLPALRAGHIQEI